MTLNVRRTGNAEYGQYTLDMLPKRFRDKVKISESGCWDWVGGKTIYGQGRYWHGGKLVLAYRYSYEFLTGQEIQNEIDHLCCNKSCVNPDHLEDVTRMVNQLRANNPIVMRRFKTVCVNGHLYSDANTYWRKNGTRECKRCNADRSAKNRAIRGLNDIIC